jgi:hypothetical protein
MRPRSISLTVRTLHVVSSAETPMKAWEIARRLGCQCNCVRVLLMRLVDSRKVTRYEQADGVYFWTPPEDDYPKIWDLWGVK